MCPEPKTGICYGLRFRIYFVQIVGAAVIAGLCVLFARFSLEAYVLDHFKNDRQEEPSEYLKEMKLCHLITMPMGFESPMLMGVIRPQMMEIYCGMGAHGLKKNGAHDCNCTGEERAEMAMDQFASSRKREFPAFKKQYASGIVFCGSAFRVSNAPEDYVFKFH